MYGTDDGGTGGTGRTLGFAAVTQCAAFGEGCCSSAMDMV